MTGSRPKGTEDGMSMVDILVATVLLGIAIVALMTGFSYTSAGTRENRGRIQATMLAQEAMENLKRNDGASTCNFKLAVPEDAKAESTDGTTSYNLEKNGVTYAMTLSKLPVADVSALAKLQPVRLTVAWTEAGATRRLSFFEYIYLK